MDEHVLRFFCSHGYGGNNVVGNIPCVCPKNNIVLTNNHYGV